MFRQAEGHPPDERQQSAEGGREEGRKATANNIYPPTEPNRRRPPREGEGRRAIRRTASLLPPAPASFVCCSTRNARQSSCACSVADEVLFSYRGKQSQLRDYDRPNRPLDYLKILCQPGRPVCRPLARTTSLSISLIWAVKRGCFSVAQNPIAANATFAESTSSSRK